MCKSASAQWARVKVREATATTLDGGFNLLVREATDEPWKTMRRWGPHD